MTRDSLEFLISQCLDGALSPQEAASLERLLADDGEARALLDEYRRLDRVLKTSLPMPRLDWDAMAEQLSSAVAEAQVSDAVHEPLPLRAVEGMRVGDLLRDEPIRQRTLKMPWVRNFARLAMAASVLLAAAAGLRYFARPAATPIAKAPVVDVVGPVAEAPDGRALVEVSIGPGAGMTREQADARFADSVVAHPSSVVIATRIDSAQDSLPY